MKPKKSDRDKRARKSRPSKPRAPKDGQAIAERSARRGVPEEELQGPPARETVLMRAEPERRIDESPPDARLTGGDVDADWARAADVGEEAVGGTVATPDQDQVDQLGNALGVPRAPDEEVRTSSEILEGRDRNRWEQEP